MRPHVARETLLFSLFFVLGAGCSPPPVLRSACDGSFCGSSTGTLGNGGGTGGTGGGDGATGTGTDGGNGTAITGLVYQVPGFPSTGPDRNAAMGSGNWTVGSWSPPTMAPSFATTVQDGTFNLGAYTLNNGELYLQLTPPTGASAGLPNLVRTEPGAANVRLPAVTLAQLQAAVSSSGATLDLNAGHAWLELGATGGTSLAGIRAAVPSTTAGFVAYDALPIFSQGAGQTGTTGLVLLYNLQLGRGVASAVVQVTLGRTTATGTATQTVNVQMAPGALSYRTVALTI